MELLLPLLEERLVGGLLAEVRFVVDVERECLPLPCECGRPSDKSQTPWTRRTRCSSRRQKSTRDFG